jgi:hypothetical protein
MSRVVVARGVAKMSLVWVVKIRCASFMPLQTSGSDGVTRRAAVSRRCRFEIENGFRLLVRRSVLVQANVSTVLMVVGKVIAPSRRR